MDNIEWKEVGLDSSNIERIGYYLADLYVEFKSNTAYKYLNVPFEVFQRILNKECISKSEGRPSYGATFDTLVKKVGYRYIQYK